MGGFPRCPWLLLLLLAAVLLLPGCNGREAQLSANGTIEATQVRVVAEVSGQLKELAVTEGDRVKAGQILARLDASTYQTQMEQAQAAVDSAGAGLAEARSGSRTQDIEAAQHEAERLAAQAAAAQEQVSQLEDSLARTEALYEQGAAAEKDLTSLESQLKVARYQWQGAQAALEAARSRLALLEAGNRPETIQRQEAGVRQSQAGLDMARLNLKKTELTAPVSAVVARLNFSQGELVNPGAEIVTLLDDTDLWLNVYVPENKLGRVKVGQTVSITVDTYPGRVFPGRVTYIAPEAEFTPRNVQTKEDRVNLVFQVKVQVTEGQDALRPGLPADVIF